MPKQKTHGKASKNTNVQRCGPRGAHRVRLSTEPAVDQNAAGLFISGEAFARDCDAMQACGIGRVVALGCKPHFPADFQYLELHINDSPDAKVSRLLHPAAAFVASGLEAGEGVLVHCKAGICRSATIVLAFLLLHRRDLAPTLDSALLLLREARPCVQPRPEFMAALQRLEKMIAGEEGEGEGESVDQQRQLMEPGSHGDVMPDAHAAVITLQRRWRWRRQALQVEGVAEDADCEGADWEADDFELAPLSAMPTAGGSGHSGPFDADAVDDDDDEWMASAEAASDGPASGAAVTAVDWRGSSLQARSLCTPASQKRRRCAECTRPLNDEDERLCARCTGR